MKRRSSLPIFIILWALYILASSIIIHTIKASDFSDWFFYFPYFISIMYFNEKISRFGPEKWEIKVFQTVSNMPVRERVTFWVSTLGVSIISVLEGFFLPSINPYIGFLLMTLNFLIWVGMLWIGLKNELFNEKNKQATDQSK